MGLTVEETPNRIVNGLDSNVCALKSQIPYRFLRVDLPDYDIIQAAFGGLTIAIAFVEGDGTGLEFTEVGDLFFLDFADTYETGVFPARSVGFPTAPPNGQITFDIPFTAVTTANINLLTGRANYNVSINVLDVVTGLSLLPAPIRFKPKQDGTLFIDLHGLFFGFQAPEDDFRFRVQFTENFNGIPNDTGITDETVGLNAFKQVLDDGGSNMWERLPAIRDAREVIRVNLAGGSEENPLFILDALNTDFNVGEFLTYDLPTYKNTAQIFDTSFAVDFLNITDSYKGDVIAGSGLSLGEIHRPGGLFLTDFDNPLQWLYYARQISFVMDSDFITRTGSPNLVLNVLGKDSAGSNVVVLNPVFNGTGIKRFDIPRIDEVATWHITMLGGALGTDIISETKIYTQLCAPRNSMMIEWQNRSGGIEHHVFSINQGVNTTTDEGLLYTPAIVDTLDNIENGIGRLPLSTDQVITLIAEKITPNFQQQLGFIKGSELVFLYLDVEGTKKTEVAVVNDFSVPRETDHKLVDYTLEIQLPPDFNIDNV